MMVPRSLLSTFHPGFGLGDGPAPGTRRGEKAARW
jgi:hypothetical protein